MNKIAIGYRPIKNVCVVGGGNEGHYFLALIGSRGDMRVSLLTRQPEVFQHEIVSLNTTNGMETVGIVDRISSNADEVIPDADMVLFLVPSNTYKMYLDKVKMAVKPGTVLGFIPGTGGVEFAAKYFMDKGCPVFGTQRVPSGTKIVKKGYKVESLGSRKDLRVACMPSRLTGDVCRVLGELLQIKTIALPNYLAVTLTPSNPILHTSRLYGLFHDYNQRIEYNRNLSFYKKWDNLSSEMLLGCDDELQMCCKSLTRYDLSQVLPLREHYEIDRVSGDTDIERMTNKIHHLDYLKDLVPMYQLKNGKFVPNFDSRYFTEDFPFGLAIIKAFCEICKINTPYIDKVLEWYDSLFQKGYYINKKFIGEGLKGLPIPQNYGITDIESLYSYYEGINNDTIYTNEVNLE